MGRVGAAEGRRGRTRESESPRKKLESCLCCLLACCCCEGEGVVSFWPRMFRHHSQLSRGRQLFLVKIPIFR